MSRLLNAAGDSVTDAFKPLADDEANAGSGAAIVNHARWLAEAGALTAKAQKLAVRLPNTLDVSKLDAAALTLPMLVLEFPAFADGRAYSQAALLRRLGYRGVLRAAGAAVVADQLLMLKRCGIDEFELRDDQSLEGLIDLLQKPTPPYYQPA